MNIQDLFKSLELKLHSDLQAARASVAHAPTKGAANERAAQQFFRSRLPRNLEIAGGFLIDTTGKISRQLDLIIYDAAKTPVLYETDNARVIPIECAYAVVEVKTNLTSDALKDCIENMKSAKSLQKLSFYEPGVIIRPTRAYGREYEHWPLMYFVFAYDSIKLGSLALRLEELQSEFEIDNRIDCIYSLSNGLIANKDSLGKLNAIPEPGSNLVCCEHDSLLLFYILISHYFNQAHMEKFNFNGYVRMMSWKIYRP